MTPADIRNDHHAARRDGHAANRAAVLAGLRAYGPCDTRALAESMQWDVLAVRPRVTELVQAGLAVLDGRNDNGGIYRAATPGEAQATIRSKLQAHSSQLIAPSVQTSFPFFSVNRRHY
ncbi:hypothetical protein [Geminisphaera colitermitum]|uniref:hypothetical protein n=1 Tax=Geminisphaera colitermitum TaxID=1148786 RepID=UPI000158C715|nr:hypothetical protein [Geminisphaera colitermitum]